MNEDEVVTIDIDDMLINDSFNSRDAFLKSSLAQLMSSIERDGLLQPVVVRLGNAKKYDLVAGFRRTHAVKMLGWTKIKALVKDISYEKARFLNLQENMNRKNLTMLEEATAVKSLMEDLPHMTDRKLCSELDVSIGWLQPRLFLLQMPTQVQELASDGFLSSTGIRDIYSFIDDPMAFGAEVMRLKKKANAANAPYTLKVRLSKSRGSDAANQTRKRIPADVVSVSKHIKETFGDHIMLSTMEWVAGKISDLQLCVRLSSYAKESGKEFEFDDQGFTDIINRDRR